jgi:tetratricopeptide (TPR) repeat protein
VGADHSSYLGVYTVSRDATSVDGELTIYGPISELRFEVSVVNEEGTASVGLPAGIAASLNVDLIAAGSPAQELLVLDWGAERRYSYDGEPLTDEQQSSDYLLPATGVAADLVVRKAAGGFFAPGSYQLTLKLLDEAAQEVGGGPWNGRGGVGGAAFRIAAVSDLADEKRLLHQAANQLLEQGEIESAVSKYESLVALDPADLASYAGLGEAQFRLPDYQAAAASFEVALPLVEMGERSLVPQRLAYCYLHLGRPEEAEQVLALTYTAEEIPAVLQQLQDAMEDEGPPPK